MQTTIHRRCARGIVYEADVAEPALVDVPGDEVALPRVPPALSRGVARR